MSKVYIVKNIDSISTFIYQNGDLLNEFFQKIYNRTKVFKDDSKGESIKFLQNTDGDSYHTPYSNE